MPRVNYEAPSSVDEAVKVLAAASGLAKVMAGGTDLLVQLRSGRIKPDLIVDTKRIPGLIGIREEGGFFVVGAATPGVLLSGNAALEFGKLPIGFVKRIGIARLFAQLTESAHVIHAAQQ